MYVLQLLATKAQLNSEESHWKIKAQKKLIVQTHITQKRKYATAGWVCYGSCQLRNVDGLGLGDVPSLL